MFNPDPKPTPAPKKKRKRMPFRSDRRKEEEEMYKILRVVFLESNPKCSVEGCRHMATEVHHMKGRIGKLLIEPRYFLSACHECHINIEINPEWAKENGYSLNRL